MGLVFFSKTGAELSFIFAVTSIVIRILGKQSPSFVPLVILICVMQLCFFADAKYGKSKRFFPLPIAVLGLAFCGGIFEIAQFALAFFACVAIIKMRQYSLDYFAHLDSFKKTMGIIGAFLAVSIVLGFFSDLQRDVLAYIIMYFLFSFFTLSLLRHTKSTLVQKRFQFVNTALLIGCVIISWLISADWFFEMLKNIALGVYKYAITPVLSLFGFVFGMGLVIISKILGWVFRPDWSSVGTESYFSGETSELINELTYTGSNPTFDIVVKIVACAVVLYVAYKLLRRQFGTRAGANATNGEKEIRTAYEKQRAEKETGSPERQGVRAIYKKFLLLCTKRGMKIKASHTTQDIQNYAAGYMENPSYGDELRNIYINVRYGLTEPKHEDAQDIKKLYNKIKKNKQEDIDE